MSNTLQFKEFSSFVNISFWHELSNKKLDELKLSEEPIPLNAHYTFSPSQQLDPFLCLEFNAFLKNNTINTTENTYVLPPRSYLSHGTLFNYNTVDDFKQSPKLKLFDEASKRIWNDIKNGNVDKDTSLLNRFILLTYADIKNHQFYYMFGIPALLPSQPIQQFTEQPESINIESIKSFSNQSLPQYFCLRQGDDQSSFELIGSIEEKGNQYLNDCLKDGSIPLVGFCDPCPLPSNPGWPLRNFLIYLSVKYPSLKKVKVICFRGNGVNSNNILLSLELPSMSELIEKQQQDGDQWSGKSVGWEKDTNGKIAPRFVSLASTMDPLKLAEQSVDLNLKLMRWRVMPSLELEKIKNTSCLLLGSGTLGCNVARSLMSWGVRNITFVDSSKVSYSNPVRQSLFTFADCSPKAKEKSVAAADALKKIFPAVNANAEVFSIPMPGHSVPSSEYQSIRDTIEHLENLIKQHDVIYLLTDSRESRWLPTMLSRAHGKLCINAALGFDSYLVIRHGIKNQCPAELNNSISSKLGYEGSDLGCYFCNDVIAPTDTLKDRTLDQMCTVTRPGLSMMASSIAVELLISTIHHPYGGRAKGETETDVYTPGSTPLGIIPHQLRGFISHYQTLPLFSNPYKHCTACSDYIIDEYRSKGFHFILNVMNDSSCLTKICGIDELKNSEVNIDWDIDISDDEEDNNHNKEKEDLN
ncbi:hypothetical protein RB653_009738 [Dictyostelium firmibasis]|uniref:Ubiquitin-like modifier-activating enzyme ATG7 n=1 Tax=Dictyostelium firmibasis TaxID=79012 RepID=A0AAN7TY14_9MYCE